jgi:ribulose-5-phosphate 4-epimerase/fuculose-1-phosphate aldolase
MWDYYKDNKPTTPPGAPFGTPEIANEIRKLMKKEQVLEDKIIVMGGHDEGLITFGKDVEEAGNTMLEYFNAVNNSNQNKK